MTQNPTKSDITKTTYSFWTVIRKLKLFTHHSHSYENRLVAWTLIRDFIAKRINNGNF